NFEKVILVDASETLAFEGKLQFDKVIEIIDHRKTHEAEKFPKAIAQIELVGAAATLIAEKFIEAKVDISKESALFLYGAIVSNTLNFKSKTMTERDTKAAAWLAQHCEVSKNFAYDMFLAKSDLVGEKLEKAMRHDFALFEFGGKRVGFAQLEMVE